MKGSYEADLEREYEDLTEKHKNIREKLENIIKQYIDGKVRSTYPITIQGPYGSGKTQLLYHLFKFTWKNGGIGIYTHLEKLLPPKEMYPEEYADYLKNLIDEEIQQLKKGKSKIMTGKIKEYAIDKMKALNNAGPVVLFVDEIEQQYKSLDEKIKTDDHSPLRSVVARVNNGEAGFYLVLAFAPISFYEFSKGEAQKERYLPILLPIIEPSTFRKNFGRIGNFIWWMGRGRYRSVKRIHDILEANVSNIDKISKKELQDLCISMGRIGGVKVLEEFERIETIDDFDTFRDFLIYLEPKEKGCEIIVKGIKAVKRCLIFNNHRHIFREKVIEEALKTLNRKASKKLNHDEAIKSPKNLISNITNISYYLSVVLDGLSTPDNKIPIFIDPEDWSELLNIVEEIILDFEFEYSAFTEDLKNLQEKISDFSYYIRSIAEKIEGDLKEGYCLSPRLLHALFPFPTSSPNLNPEEEITSQREKLGEYSFLAREEKDSVSIYFFLNESKIKEFLEREIKKFLKETKVLVVINLGRRGVDDVPKIAKWLQRHGRFKVITLPEIISDFLVSFFYLKKTKLPITNLFEALRDASKTQEKNKARKILYYISRIEEYLSSEMPKSRRSPQFVLRDKTGFSDFYEARIGFPSEIIGFAFVSGSNDDEAIYKFRREFEKSKFIREKAKEKRTGIPTALENIIIWDKRTNKVKKGGVLRRIRDSFNNHLPDLTEIVNEIDENEFADIPRDESLRILFKGIYLYLKKWKDPSRADEKFRDIMSKWNNIVESIDRISNKIEKIRNLTYGNIHITHCIESDRNTIQNIKELLKNYQNKISPYTKFLLSLFIEKIIEIVTPKLDEIDKMIINFKEDIEGEIKRFKDAFEYIDKFENDTFEWLNRSKKEIQEEFRQKLRNICSELTSGEKIDIEDVSLDDVDIFLNKLKEIINDLDELRKIDESIKRCKEKANKINEMLKAWGEIK